MSDTLAPPSDASTVPPEAVRRVHLGENAAAPVVVEVTRGTMVESLHRVSIAVVDSDGKTVHALGPIDRPIYGRSAIKPLQALQVIETGAADAFALGADEITLCCASHKGEAMHTDRVAAWLGRLGLSVDDLECGPQIPYHEGSAHAMLARGETPGRAHNNCSGKHSGMLTSVVHRGETVKGYLSPTTRYSSAVSRSWRRWRGRASPIPRAASTAAAFRCSALPPSRSPTRWRGWRTPRGCPMTGRRRARGSSRRARSSLC